MSHLSERLNFLSFSAENNNARYYDSTHNQLQSLAEVRDTLASIFSNTRVCVVDDEKKKINIGIHVVNTYCNYKNA